LLANPTRRYVWSTAMEPAGTPFGRSNRLELMAPTDLDAVPVGRPSREAG
jgi:hypothetical protein